ncbi:hypothetical protein Acr_01g0009320 [Actinidia rufa]|uniref:Transposase (putative) gypsy type domain-containing protein n=1 Tax=Actinidia rufa TaxID=165716 RepID=A0A7J0E3M7_9ERIC|nr:hypothetical protein Acr_01g0009320 [Actinidia rufa]
MADEGNLQTLPSGGFPQGILPEVDVPHSAAIEINSMTQGDLDHLWETCSFLIGVQTRIPRKGETVLSASSGKVAFYEATFPASLRFPVHPTIRRILDFYGIYPAQLSSNAWRNILSVLVRPVKNVLKGAPSNVKGWKRRFFFVSGDDWEFHLMIPREEGTYEFEVMGHPSKQCNKLPILSSPEEERFLQVFEKIGGGHFKILVILNLRTFYKYFAPGQVEVYSSGGGMAGAEVGGEVEGDIRGESAATTDHASESSRPTDVSHLGVPSREGSVELAGIIREEMLSPHAKAAVALASKGVVISEGFETVSKKRALDNGFKGKQVASLPEVKKTKIGSGVHEVPTRPPAIAGEGSSVRRTLREAMGPQASVMASAATAEKILAGVILPADKEKVGKLTFDQVVTKFLHVLGSHFGILAIHCRDFTEGALNQRALMESSEMEMVRAQNRAIKLEGALAEEKTKGKKAVEEIQARNEVVASWRRESPSWKQFKIWPKGESSRRSKNIEMDHNLLAQEEIEAEKRAAEDEEAAEEEGTGECFSVLELNLAIDSSLPLPLFLSIRVNFFLSYYLCPISSLGDEEFGQSLPSWISDHLGGKSYIIDETNQSSLFSTKQTDPPEMDTSSLTKETNVMSQANLDKLREKYSFPPRIQLRIPREGETILSIRQGKVAFYEATFLAGLRLPIHPTIRRILNHYKICPTQLSPNAWCLYSLNLLPDSRWYYFKARPKKNLLQGSSSNVKGRKKRFFFASGNEWEFFPRMLAGDGIPRVPRSWGTLGKSCNKLPALTEVEAKRTAEVLGKVKPRGYYDVSKVLGSRTFNKHFAVSRIEISSSGGDNITSDDEGEFHGSSREDSVEYLGAIRWDTRLRTSSLEAYESSSDSRSESMLNSELPPELRSDAMSAWVGVFVPIEKMGKKAVDENVGKKVTPQLPLKWVVIQEKCPQEGDHAAEKGGLDSSKGKAVMPLPLPKRFKSNKEANNTTLRTSIAGTSSPGVDLGFGASMMSDALVARRLLNGGAKSATDIGKTDVVANLEAEVAELTRKLTKAKELAIEEFKIFRRLQGIDVENMEMDPSFAEEEEATKEGKEGVGIGGLA